MTSPSCPISKVCTGCKEKKSIYDFYEAKGGKMRCRGECKICTLQNVKKNADETKKNKERLIDYLADRYGGIPCMDCGSSFPYCAMDWDHRPNTMKSFSISSMGGSYKATKTMIAKVEKEIAKCDLVCSNCHRVRTWITRKK